jgi:hypothetical protein
MTTTNITHRTRRVVQPVANTCELGTPARHARDDRTDPPEQVTPTGSPNGYP